MMEENLSETQPEVNTSQFRRDYAILLKEILEESSEDEEDMLNSIHIDLDTATAELPEDLRIALEDRSLADKYLANLKTFLHRRSQSVNSSGKEYSLPNTPLQTSFNQALLSPKPFERIDPLSKVLDAIPYQTRLVNGVPSLTLLEQKFYMLVIPELELPVMSETAIQMNLNELYKLRDDLSIHFNGGPLNSNTIGERKKRKVVNLLDDVCKEIGLYEEFVKKANYLNLENILNETDSSDIENDTVNTDSTYFDSQKPFQTPSTTIQDESYASSDFTVNSIQPWEAFKWTPLVRITDQLYSDDIKQESGLISVMSVGGLMAIGTTRSLIFVYDYSQNLKCILGDSSKAIEIGAVTALALSTDNTTLLSGHSQGHIFVWDIRKPAHPLRVIEPDQKKGHVQGASILHVDFASKKSEIISADDLGMVFFHVSYTMMMITNTYSIRLIGQYPARRTRRQNPKKRKPSTIFSMQILPHSRVAHPAENFNLVAILTPYKMLVIALKPKPHLLFKFIKPNISKQQDESNAVVESLSGYLAWLPLTDKEDPLLAFGWGKHLFVLCVKTDYDRGIHLKFNQMGNWKSKDPIVAIQWINRQILSLFTLHEELVLFDPKHMREIQYTNVRNKRLVYHDWFSTPLNDLVLDAAGSPEQSVLKSVEMAYSGSIKCYKGRMFLLGLDQIYIGTLLSWKDRLLLLVQSSEIIESIELATSFYNGINLSSVIGLPEDENSRKAVVGEKLVELLEASIQYTFSERNGVSEAGLACSCIEACLSMNRLDFLFETIYEHFLENKVAGPFLEALVPCIIQDRIPDIPPSIMKELVDHYSKKRLLDELEQIIWHVNPRCLDIDQVVSMCRREGMYEAMMYVWNKSMHDYVSPLVEILKVIRIVLRSNPEDQQTIQTRQGAEKIFDYLRLVLRGKSFPSGATTSSYEAGEARSAVYSFVFSGRCVVWPPFGGQLVMTIDDDENMLEPTYPYLRLLLRFNTKKFLESLEDAFEDPWLNGGEDILSSKFDDEVPGKVISRQIIVNTLLDVFGGGLLGNTLPPPQLKPSSSASTVQSLATNGRSAPLNLKVNTTVANEHLDYFSNQNIILLYIFIASNLHKYTTFILLPLKTLNNVLMCLAEDHDSDTRSERETAAQNLLTVYTPANQEKIIKLYEEAGFWKVLEDVYCQEKKYGKLVSTYLKDDERRDRVFDCVYELLTNLDEMQKEEVMRVFMIRISQFVEIDGQRAAEIVDVFGDHEDAIRRLEEDQEFDDDEFHVDKRLFSYLRGLLEPDNDKEISDVSSTILERYVELMCRFDPSGVYNYLSTRLKNNVSLEKIRASCEKYGVMDAVVWIMERNGNTIEALDKMLGIAAEKSEIITQLLETHDQSSIWTFDEINTINSCLINLNGILRVSTQLCQNNTNPNTASIKDESDNEDASQSSQTTEDDKTGEILGTQTRADRHVGKEAEILWFRLLDAYIGLSVKMRYALVNSASEIQQKINSSFMSYVQSITLFVPSQLSLSRVLLQSIDSRSKTSAFEELRDIAMDALDTHPYKEQLKCVTDCLSDYDLFKSLRNMASQSETGWLLDKLECRKCGDPILDLSPEQQIPIIKKYTLFGCGHYYHSECSLMFLKADECDYCKQTSSNSQRVNAEMKGEEETV